MNDNETNETNDIGVLTTAVTMLRTAEEKIEDIVDDLNAELGRMQKRVSEDSRDSLWHSSKIEPPNLEERITILLTRIGELVIERDNA